MKSLDEIYDKATLMSHDFTVTEQVRHFARPEISRFVAQFDVNQLIEDLIIKDINDIGGVFETGKRTLTVPTRDIVGIDGLSLQDLMTHLLKQIRDKYSDTGVEVIGVLDVELSIELCNQLFEAIKPIRGLTFDDVKCFAFMSYNELQIKYTVLDFD